MLPTSGNPYQSASFLEKFIETGTIFLTDLDDTHATRGSSDQELDDRAAVRSFLDERGWVSGAVTARTPGLVMSSDVFEASRANGYQELQPHCGVDASGKHIYVPPEGLRRFAHSQNWDFIGSLGWGVYPRNGHGYLVDEEFDNILNYDHAGYRPAAVGPGGAFQLDQHVPWRQAALALLTEHAPKAGEPHWPQESVKHYWGLSPLESVENYWNGKTDVAPLPYRIQMSFKGVEGLERLRKLKEILEVRRFAGDRIAARMALVDESKPDEDPRKSTYTVYLLPWRARKEAMIQWFTMKSLEAARQRVPDFSIKNFLYAGDTPTDLRAGLYARSDGPMKFLLATGSRLADYIVNKRMYYGEEPLDFLWESSRRPKSRLAKTGKKGVYDFKVPGRPWTNTLVIGTERYRAMTPPGSVRAFLEEFARDT